VKLPAEKTREKNLDESTRTRRRNPFCFLLRLKLLSSFLEAKKKFDGSIVTFLFPPLP
jgi:hypothetical protein